MSLLDKSLVVYGKGGQSGVLSWATRIGVKSWAWCEPCEYNSPMSDNTCLVCWTVREEK